MRMAVETRRLSDELGLTDTPRLLQRGLGRLRRPAELPARGRHRREHAPRPRRDRVLVPDPDPRLPVGRRCRWWPPAATRSATSSTSTAWGSPCRRVTSTRSRRRCSGCSTSPTSRGAAARLRPGLSEEYRWTKVLQPLIEFCRAPHRAPDLVDPDMAAALPSMSAAPVVDPGRCLAARAARARLATSARSCARPGGRVKRALAAGR